MRRWHDMFAFGLVAVSTVAGILGMGLLYKAFTTGSLVLGVWGLPLLLVGLYWSGLALGQSLQVFRAKRQSLPKS